MIEVASSFFFLLVCNKRKLSMTRPYFFPRHFAILSRGSETRRRMNERERMKKKSEISFRKVFLMRTRFVAPASGHDGAYES